GGAARTRRAVLRHDPGEGAGRAGAPAMTQAPQSNRAVPVRKVKRDTLVAAICGAVAAGMVGMSFAAVPLYDWFCRTTGFGGTTQVSVVAPGEVLDREVTIRFDSNVAPGLRWR